VPNPRAHRPAGPPRAGVLSLLLTIAALLAAAPASEAAPVKGVQAHLLWGNVGDAEMDRQLNLAKEAGAGLIRVDLGWTTLEEEGKGRYSGWYLRKIDRLVAAAEARGLRLLLTVIYSPCWASTAPASLKQDCSPGWWDRGVATYAPRDPGDYADAMAFLAARYRGRVAGWEVWNEPNLKDFWRSAEPVRDYVALVRAAYPRIKEADPSALVVAGSLADAAYAYADELYRAGMKGSFDALSIHPYSGDNSPLDPLSSAYAHASFISGVPAVRDVMLKHGDDRPLWLTEFGYNTSAIRRAEPWRNGVDPETQARYLEQAYTKMRDWDYVPVGVWYNLKDRGTDPANPHHHYGLVRTDDSPKPAYHAYKRVLSGSADLGVAVPARGKANRKPRRLRGSRVRFRLLRTRRGVYVRGRARRRTVVRLAGYRFDRRARRFRARPSLRLRIRVSHRGRFSRRLPNRRVSRGLWRFTARLGRRPARATLRVAIR
jgi:hypothetical protein